MNQGSPSGYAGNNLAGRLVEAETDDCTWPPTGSHMLTDEWFSYDKNGRLTDLLESTLHSGGYYHTTASYFLNGEVNTLSGIPGYATLTYTLDADGKMNTAVHGTFSLVSGVTRNVMGEPTTIAIGSSGVDSDTYTYDPATGRMTNWTFSVKSVAQTGTLTWNPNRTLGQLIIADGFNAGGAQTCTFTYDDVARLTADNCGSVWSQTFGYDQYDNVWKSGSSSWACSTCYDANTNRYNSSLSGSITYDARGNLLNDTFHQYSWDAYGHTVTIGPATGAMTCGNSGIRCITYDAEGRAVEEQLGTVYTQILYSPLGKTAIMSGQTTSKAYIPLPGGATAYLTGSTGGSRQFWHKDWLGSVRVASTIANRTIAYDRAFAPYGEMYDNFGSTTGLDFTGDTQDLVAGTFDTPNRELNPTQGRWLSPDLAGGDWNAYAYGTNPHSGTDPDGLLFLSGDVALITDPVDGPDPATDRTQDTCKSAGGNACAPAQNTSQTQPKPGEEHKGEPYSLKPEGSSPAGNGAKYYSYQVVDPTGKPVRDVSVQEHVKVVAAENVNPSAAEQPIHYPTGEVTDRVGPLGPPRTDIHSFLKTEQTFTATKDGKTYGMSTKTNQYVINNYGTVTVQVVVVVP